MWFLTAGPVVRKPMILAELPESKNCWSFFKKHNCHEWVQFFDMYRCFFSCLHLAVGHHHRRRTHVSRAKVSLADHMHTSSGINHKLSFLLLFCWRSQKYPFFRGGVDCNLVILFELVNVFWQGSKPCFGHIAEISQGRDFADENLWLIVFQATVRSFPGCLLDEAWWAVLLESIPRLFASGFSRTVLPLWETNASESCETQPNGWYNFHNGHSILVVAFSSFVGIVAFLWLFVWLFINLVMREQTLAYPLLCNPFLFCQIDTREDANLHKVIACKYLSNNIGRVVEEWHHGYFCLGYFFSPTHFDLVTRMAQKVWRHCVLFFAHDRYSHAGNCIGLLSNTGLFLSTGNKYLFLLQRHSFPFDSWSLLLFQFSRAWRQTFVIGVSDPYSFSPLSSISDNWASISSDESPCRTIPIRFWVARTHVFSICTDFPRYHRMESLT